MPPRTLADYILDLEKAVEVLVDAHHEADRLKRQGEEKIENASAARSRARQALREFLARESEG